MFVQVHHEDGGHEAEEVRGECNVEVKVAFPLQAVVVAEKKRDEDARDDNVAKTEHGKVASRQAVLQQILRKDHCTILCD